MRKDVQYYIELKKAYPQTMSKDQFYRVAHISKATALYLLSSGIIPCKDTGKKTRRYTIRTDDVIKYLIDRRIHPQRYTASQGWYSGTAGCKKQETNNQLLTVSDLTKEERKRFKGYLESELTSYEDLMSVKETVEFTGYSTAAVLGWCSKGKVKYFCVSGRYLIPKISLVKYLMSWDFDRIKVKSWKHKVILCDLVDLVKVSRGLE